MRKTDTRSQTQEKKESSHMTATQIGAEISRARMERSRVGAGRSRTWKERTGRQEGVKRQSEEHPD